MKIKPGHEQGAVEAFRTLNLLANGHFGWNGNAKLFLDCGLFPHMKGNRRIRVKKVKRLIQSVFWNQLMEHFEE